MKASLARAQGRWLWLIVVAAIVLGLFVFAAAIGLRAFSISTPSMGTTYPVGTLVITEPQQQYRVADPITFTVNDRVYTHRITESSDQGFSTRGDLNDADDAWVLPAEDVIGKVIWSAKGMGWLLNAAPWLLLGVILSEVMARLLPNNYIRWRGPLRFIGISLTVSIIGLVLRPWFNMEMLNWKAENDGVVMNLVNTGLFPMKAKDVGGVASGEVVAVHLTEANDKGIYLLRPTPDLSVLQWCIVTAICLLPLAYALVITARRRRQSVLAHTRAPRRFRLASTAITTVAILAVVGTLTLSTQAAFSAKIQNTADTAGARTFFTCRDAVTKTSNVTLGYSLESVAAGGFGLTDLSSNANNATLAGTAAVDSTATGFGCLRDAPKQSMTFNGTDTCVSSPKTSAPNTYTLEAWFKSSPMATNNGKIIGFDGTINSSTGRLDHMVYMDSDGRIIFANYIPAPNAAVAIARTVYAQDGVTLARYDDNKWHHVVASWADGTGGALYLDGVLAASVLEKRALTTYDGFLHVGCGGLGNYPRANGQQDQTWPLFFTGQIQYASLYSVALTAAQVKEHYLAGVK